MGRPSPTRDRILRLLLGTAMDSTRVPVPTQKTRRFVPDTIRDLAQYVPPEADQAEPRSYAWVHEVVSEFVDAGWVTRRPRLEVVDPAAVFEWWSENRTRPKHHSFHLADPMPVLEAMLRRHPGAPSVITTYYAEQAFQGHLFPRRMDAYICEADLDHAKRVIIDEGGQLGGTNFRLWTGDDGIVDEPYFAQEGVTWPRYAPLPQVILDLMTEGGSAREAADMLLQRAYPHANASLS